MPDSIDLTAEELEEEDEEAVGRPAKRSRLASSLLSAKPESSSLPKRSRLPNQEPKNKQGCSLLQPPGQPKGEDKDDVLITGEAGQVGDSAGAGVGGPSSCSTSTHTVCWSCNLPPGPSA